MLIKSRYYLKRYGLYGYIRHKLNQKNIIPFDSYYYLQKKYYEKLSEDDYEKELGEWYSIYYGGGIGRIRNPISFNDKIQWLKINDNTELRAVCADKIGARDYVKGLNIPELHIIPLLGVWERAEEIDFTKLPDAFVLKQNAACKLNLIVRDIKTLDKKRTINQMGHWLEISYGYNGMELQYLKIAKRIIAEQYLHEMDGNLTDYKVFCFNGRPQFIEVIGDRGNELQSGRSAFFDINWNIMDFRTVTYPKFEDIPEKPNNLSSIISIAEALSRPFRFVRVDLYNINGSIYFGELTFTPTNGIAKWIPAGTDEMLGKLITL